MLEKSINEKTGIGFMISVVIPVYNRQEYIIDAIESVRHQTYHPLEIIVVDDSSTDGVVSVIDEYSQKNGLKIFISTNKRSKGVSGARNTGVELARGDYIAFLDSDDIWLPEHLKRLHDCRLKTNVEIISAAFSFFGIPKKSKFNIDLFKMLIGRILENGFELKGENQYLSDDRLFQTAMLLGMPFRIQSSLISKRVFLDHNIWFDENIAYLEDHHYLIECAYKRLSVAFVDEISMMIRISRNYDHYEKLENLKYRMGKFKRTFDRSTMNAKEKEVFFLALYEMGWTLMKMRSKKRNVARRIMESFKLLFQFQTNKALRESIKNIIGEMPSRFLVGLFK